MEDLFDKDAKVLPGADTAQAAVLVARRKETFAVHAKWWQTWEWYATQFQIDCKSPHPSELAAFVGWIVDGTTASQGLKALSSIRQKLTYKAAYYGNNSMLLACLTDGLKAIAGASQRPKVAVQLDILNKIINLWLDTHDMLEPKIVRIIAFTYLMYGTGARPGELDSVKWQEFNLLDNSLDFQGDIHELGYGKLLVAVYRLKLVFWEKQSRVVKTSCIIPCATLTTIWLAHWFSTLQLLRQRQFVSSEFVFANLDGHSDGHATFSAMSEEWDDLRFWARKRNVIPEEVAVWGSLYGIKRGLITDLQEQHTPLSLSMAITRHRSVTSHLVYFTPNPDSHQQQVLAIRQKLLKPCSQILMLDYGLAMILPT